MGLAVAVATTHHLLMARGHTGSSWWRAICRCWFLLGGSTESRLCPQALPGFEWGLGSWTAGEGRRPCSLLQCFSHTPGPGGQVRPLPAGLGMLGTPGSGL